MGDTQQKVQFLKGMFSSLDNDVITAILANHNGDVDAASTELMELSGGGGAERIHAHPVPPAAKPKPIARPPPPSAGVKGPGPSYPPFGGAAGRGGGARRLALGARTSHAQQERQAQHEDDDPAHDELDYVAGDEIQLLAAANNEVEK